MVFYSSSDFETFFFPVLSCLLVILLLNVNWQRKNAEDLLEEEVLKRKAEEKLHNEQIQVKEKLLEAEEKLRKAEQVKREAEERTCATEKEKREAEERTCAAEKEKREAAEATLRFERLLLTQKTTDYDRDSKKWEKRFEKQQEEIKALQADNRKMKQEIQDLRKRNEKLEASLLELRIQFGCREVVNNVKNRYILAANASLRDQRRADEQKSTFAGFLNMDDPPLVPKSVLQELFNAGGSINLPANDFAHDGRLEGPEYAQVRKEVRKQLRKEIGNSKEARYVLKLEEIMMADHSSKKRKRVDTTAKFEADKSPPDNKKTEDDIARSKLVREKTDALKDLRKDLGNHTSPATEIAGQSYRSPNQRRS